MRRAYGPRLSTLDLVAAILARPGVASARIIAPTHGTHPRPAGMRVTLSALSGDGSPIRTDFRTLAEARAWLAADIAADAAGTQETRMDAPMR